jgi:PAS domain S-box-containing protein
MRPRLTSSIWTWGPIALALLFVSWGIALFASARNDQRQLHHNVTFVTSLHQLITATRELGSAHAADDAAWTERENHYRLRREGVEPFAANHEGVQSALRQTDACVARIDARRAERPDDGEIWRDLGPALRNLEKAAAAVRGQSREISQALATKWTHLHVLVAIACLLALGLAVLLHLYRRDLVRRKQADEALRLAHLELQQVMNSIPDYLWSIHVDGRGRVTYRYVSSVVERITGRPPEFFLEDPQRRLSIVHPEDRQRLQEAHNRIISGQSTQEKEVYRVVWPDGAERWVHDRAVAKPQFDGTLRIDGVVADITERKTLEEQYLHAQKLEAVGRLAGGVAHDFNNLLTVINGYCDLVLNTDKDNPWRESVKEVQKAGSRATALTRQLLAFGRRQMLQPVVLDLNVVVADTEKMLRRLIGADIELVTEPAPDVRMVKIDPGQIEQVLVNLAVNARDAMPRGGRLTIAIANIDLEATPQYPEIRPGRYLRLVVRDTGCGMDDSIRARLFEPFFTTKEPGKGTGLGLATVYGIVKQAGGYIYVESEPDKGAAFIIYFPEARESVQPEADCPQPDRAATGNETILLVEDEDGVRHLARRFLQQQGYTVLEGRHGADALKVARKHQAPIDLLLTDMVMPIIDGPELVRRLRCERPHIKALYMSGYTDSALTRRKPTHDSIALLIKPFSLEKLAKTVREVLDHHKAV